jgi:hypothetical protein
LVSSFLVNTDASLEPFSVSLGSFSFFDLRLGPAVDGLVSFLTSSFLVARAFGLIDLPRVDGLIFGSTFASKLYGFTLSASSVFVV